MNNSGDNLLLWILIESFSLCSNKFGFQELVSKVLQLQSHNEQLKNIIAKRDYKKKEEAPKRREFDFKK